MQQNGVNKPKPRTAWIKDIKQHINEWKQEGEVVILINANSGLDDKDFTPFIAEIGLCDIIGDTHGIDTPNTQADGSKIIDFILCVPDIITMIQWCGMPRFYKGIHSDHQGLYKTGQNNRCE
eukprot:5721956-Ditylum_brightwellii.AAC.1